MIAPSARTCWRTPRTPAHPPVRAPDAPPVLHATLYRDSIRCGGITASGTGDAARLVGALCGLLTLAGFGDAELVVRDALEREVGRVGCISAGIGRVETW